MHENQNWLATGVLRLAFNHIQHRGRIEGRQITKWSVFVNAVANIAKVLPKRRQTKGVPISFFFAPLRVLKGYSWLTRGIRDFVVRFKLCCLA